MKNQSITWSRKNGVYVAQANGYAAKVYRDGKYWVAKVTDTDPAYLDSYKAAKESAEFWMDVR